MDPLTTELPWEEPGWLEKAIEWIQSQLSNCGWHGIGPVELIHQRAWSTLARVSTDHGTAYFKAPAPPFFEAGLTRMLEKRWPDRTLSLLAVDLEHGWLLSADAGEMLRRASPSADQVEHWVKLLPRYVELQMDMADSVPHMLELGMFDRRLATFPQLYAELMEADENLRVGLDQGLTAEEYRALSDLRPRVTALCEELAAHELPETLTHEEVHDSNVLVNGNRYVFIDWSDSSIAHPFFSMLVTIRAAAHRLQLAEDGPEMMRLRDAYLEPWTRFEPRGQLLAAFDVARRLAMINRSLSWHQGTGALSRKYKEEYAEYVPGWLQDYLVAETEASKRS